MVAPITQITAELKKLYIHSSVQVLKRKNKRLRPVDRSTKKSGIKSKSLLFFSPSPDFCIKHPDLGLQGVKGKNASDINLVIYLETCQRHWILGQPTVYYHHVYFSQRCGSSGAPCKKYRISFPHTDMWTISCQILFLFAHGSVSTAISYRQIDTKSHTSVTIIPIGQQFLLMDFITKLLLGLLYMFMFWSKMNRNISKANWTFHPRKNNNSWLACSEACNHALLCLLRYWI